MRSIVPISFGFCSFFGIFFSWRSRENGVSYSPSSTEYPQQDVSATYASRSLRQKNSESDRCYWRLVAKWKFKWQTRRCRLWQTTRFRLSGLRWRSRLFLRSQSNTDRYGRLFCIWCEDRLGHREGIDETLQGPVGILHLALGFIKFIHVCAELSHLRSHLK